MAVNTEQRCDAGHPCTPCVKLDMGSDCVYEATKRTRKELPAVVQPFLYLFKSEPGSRDSPSQVDSEDTSLSTSGIVSSDIGGSAFPPTDNDPPTPQKSSSSETQLVPFREESPKPHQPQPSTISTFSFLPSLRLSSIPRQLHTPLSVLDPKHFQVSDTTPSELDLSLCVFPFFGCGAWTSRGLSLFGQPSYSTTAIETLWDLSYRP